MKLLLYTSISVYLFPIFFFWLSKEHHSCASKSSNIFWNAEYAYAVRSNPNEKQTKPTLMEICELVRVGHLASHCQIWATAQSNRMEQCKNMISKKRTFHISHFTVSRSNIRIKSIPLITYKNNDELDKITKKFPEHRSNIGSFLTI